MVWIKSQADTHYQKSLPGKDIKLKSTQSFLKTLVNHMWLIEAYLRKSAFLFKFFVCSITYYSTHPCLYNYFITWIVCCGHLKMSFSNAKTQNSLFLDAIDREAIKVRPMPTIRTAFLVMALCQQLLLKFMLIISHFVKEVEISIGQKFSKFSVCFIS